MVLIPRFLHDVFTGHAAEQAPAVDLVVPGAATADSWEISPMPSKQIKVSIALEVSAEEMRQAGMGLIPREMEDRWFMYCNGGHMYWHRSWSGYCIFDAVYVHKGDGFLFTSLHINGSTQQYTPDDTGKAVATFYSLLRSVCSYKVLEKWREA